MRVAIFIVIGNLFLGFFLSSGQTMTIETNTLSSAAYAINQMGIAVYGEGYSGVSARGIGGDGLFCDGITSIVSGAYAYSGYFFGGKGLYISPRLGINNGNPLYPIHVGTAGADNGNGAHVTTGGAWTNGSSSTFKHFFRPVDPDLVLQKVSALKITSWNYINSMEGRHLGPVAEEFWQMFGLGENDSYISTIDADGIATAALKALMAKIELQSQTILELFERIRQLEDSTN
jgi:hypothetical protein